MDKLTEEQKKKIDQLQMKFILKALVAGICYIGFLFLANFIIVSINLAYVHDQQFVRVCCIGTAFVMFVGWNGTIRESYDIFKEEVVKVLNK